jgi:hypothetical protein
MTETTEIPANLTNCKLPEAVKQRLQTLLLRRNGGEELTLAEELEAEGLVEIAHFLSLQKETRETLKVKGIVRGEIIELLEPISTEDGTEVLIEISHPIINTSQVSLSNQEKLIEINRLFGVWKDRSDLMNIFAEIDRERHEYRGRVIDPLES